MDISVIICTWNRAALLDQTLAELRKMHIPEGVTWELLVVNNACTDDTDAVIARHSDALPLRRLFEANPGKSHAANLAVREARGELLLWTDDDVLVDPEWLAEYHAAAKELPGAMYFGGPVEPWFATEPPAWIRRHFNDIAMAFATRRVGGVSRPMEPTEYPYGVNLATRRAAFAEVAYDVRVGPRHKSEVRGEDVALVDAFRARGMTGRWVCSATLRHYIPPERLTVGYIRAFYAGQAKTVTRIAPADVPKLWGVPRWAIRQYAVESTKAVFLSPFKNESWLKSLKTAAWAKGVMAELWSAGTRPRFPLAFPPSASAEAAPQLERPTRENKSGESREKAGPCPRTPKVSICLPVYNGEQYLPQTIDSILSQSFEDFELILADNASTDNTQALCRAAAERDPRVRFEPSPTNRGLAWNFNRVVPLARGEFLVWIGGDDVMGRDYVARCVAALEADPQSVLAFSHADHIDEAGRVIRTVKRNSGSSDVAATRVHDILFNDLCDPIIGVIRTSVLKQTRLHLPYADSDRVLLTELGLRGRFTMIDQTLYERRMHAGQTTTQHKDRSARTHIYDPSRKGRASYPWIRQVRDLITAVWRAKLGWTERWRCFKAITWWFRAHQQYVYGEVRRGFGLTLAVQRK